ncbi:isochorismatase family cysteine hydrolase [Leptospira sp. GIMC2001]|uniref:isochorismatase family cysteine hydrolase n=1 Tax=Leptospira sp. GIMC2001 TaxID=1513297 RepID=UPI00234A46EA|nr:isochorismatase family cysteine hydrolase [Leptospira sp. GIMC2001]WCL50663.1 cysteine hydrolase [Leptospira sp. GIMC2001]
MKNALIVIIDPQNDFTHANGQYAKRHSGITFIKRALEKIDVLIKSIEGITKAVIYSDYDINQFEANLSICIPGTFGHKLNLEIKNIDYSFIKKEYSIFSSKEFIDFLWQYKIDTIYISGFLTEYCIRSSIFDAAAQNYSIIVLEDCIGTGDDVQHRNTDFLIDLQKSGIKLTSSEELIKILS